MARLGLFLVHEGVWDQSRLVDEDWIYMMTRPPPGQSIRMA